MKTLDSYLRENGLQGIEPLVGKGRMYTKVRDQLVVFAAKVDLKKPLFIIDQTEDENGVPFPEGPRHWIVNSSVKVLPMIKLGIS